MNVSDSFLQVVKSNLTRITQNPKIKKEIDNQIRTHGVNKGELQAYYNNAETLDEADTRVVALIGEQIYLKFDVKELELSKWFNEKQIEEIKMFHKINVDTSITLPYTFENVTKIGDGYLFPIEVSVIARLYESKLLNYNHDIQRQPKFVKRNGQVIKKPYVNKKSVKEITEHLVNGTLVETNIAYNAHLGSSNGDDELIYNHKERTLTITEGTRLDILDGMHRTISCLEAYRKNKNIDFEFIGLIFNYTTKEAQNYQSQQAKANPIPKSRIQELEASRYADVVVQQLRMDSELHGRITSRDSVGKGTNELVSYGVLSNAIDRTFKMESKLQAIEVSKYLSEYFTYLFGYFQDELKQLENGNLMFYNKFFIGHVKLAKLMYDENISLENLKVILSSIDFDKNNLIFAEYGIIKEGKLSTKIEKPIIKLFNDLFIKEKIHYEIKQ